MISAKVHRLIAIGSTLAIATVATVAIAPASHAGRRIPLDIISYYNATGSLIQTVEEDNPAGYASETPPAGAVTATLANSTGFPENAYSGTCPGSGTLLVTVPSGQTLTFTNPGTGSSFLPWCRQAA